MKSLQQRFLDKLEATVADPDGVDAIIAVFQARLTVAFEEAPACPRS